MRRLKTPRCSFSRRLIRGERGAVATVFAVLLAGGVIMGMLALTVDVGAIWVERRQIQNGADAAALALAQECADDDPSGCRPASKPALQTLAGYNAGDDVTEVSAICGKGDGTDLLDECTATGAYDELTECLPLPSGFSHPYVETRTRTLRPDGSTILPKYFSELLLGGGADASVGACSRVAWGPSSGTGLTLPLVASYCDWFNSTAGGTKFAPSPPYTNPAGTSPLKAVPDEINTPKFPVKLEAHDNTKADVDLCGKDPNGQTYPGGFSWAQTCDGVDVDLVPMCKGVPKDTCIAAFDATGTVLVGSNGAPPPTDCKKDALLAFLGTEVFLPIGISWDLSSKTYKIDGVASFYLAGYTHLPTAGTEAVYVEPSYVCVAPCNSSSQYVWGWFTSGIQPSGTISTGGTPRGAEVIQPVG